MFSGCVALLFLQEKRIEGTIRALSTKKRMIKGIRIQEETAAGLNPVTVFFMLVFSSGLFSSDG